MSSPDIQTETSKNIQTETYCKHESIRVTLDNAQLIADQLSFVNSFILWRQSMYNVRWYEQPRTQTEFRVQVNVIFAIHKPSSTSSWNYSKSGVFFDR